MKGETVAEGRAFEDCLVLGIGFVKCYPDDFDTKQRCNNLETPIGYTIALFCHFRFENNLELSFLHTFAIMIFK